MIARFTAQAPIGVGVVGMGFMGATQVRAVHAAARDGLPCRLAAVCDAAPDRLTGTVATAGNIATGAGDRLFDPASVATYTDFGAMLADDRVHMVIICTHTDTHIDLSRRALEAGKHVLVEKPVALSAAGCRELASAAKAAGARGILCMPAMCIRYWPAWAWLKERIDSRKFGAVKSASFQRLGSGPSWGADFYRNNARSGGALVDLHIHDTDFVTWCFGTPREVVSAGTLDHVTTLYRYDHGPRHVTAQGGWDQAPGFPFKMRFIVTFDHATADWDLTRTPPLLLCRDGKAEPTPLPEWLGYDGEVRAIVRAIASGASEPPTTVDDAVRTAVVLDAERRSLETGAAVRVG